MIRSHDALTGGSRRLGRAGAIAGRALAAQPASPKPAAAILLVVRNVRLFMIWAAAEGGRGDYTLGSRVFYGAMTPEEFRAAGYRIVDWIADYRAQIESRPVMPPVEPGDVRRQLPRHAPVDPESMDAILADL